MATDAALHRLSSSIRSAQSRNTQGIRLALIIGLLIGALLWKTQWRSLQLGLWLLLLAQIGTVIMRFRHTSEHAKDVAWLAGKPEDQRRMLAWYKKEQVYVSWLSLFENAFRGVGFLALAYGFWRATGQIWVAILLGIVYPAVAYFGMSRRAEQSQIKRLDAQRHEMELDLMVP